jgi:phenylacetate-CoA ligase
MYQLFLENLIIPAGDLVFGTNHKRDLNYLNRSQWLTPKQLEVLQFNKLRELLVFASKNVPYYEKLFSERDIDPLSITSVEDLKCLPVLSKSIIRLHKEEIIATNRDRKSFLKAASSGSTGEPLQYYTTKTAASLRNAAVRRFWQWAGYNIGDKWVRIQLWPQSVHPFRFKLSTFLQRCAYIGSYQFNDRKIVESIKIIKKYNPKVIRGYSGPIYLIAKYMKMHNIDPIPIKAVITHSETLLPHYRELIESQFECNVFDTYGGDGKVIAGQCEFGNYHVNDENIIIEYIKDDGSPSKYGEVGNIIVTDLNNYAMPFIRYQIGDIGISKCGVCDCGRGLSMLHSIEGRDSDLIYTVNGNFLNVQYFVVYFEYEPTVVQFQAIQNFPDQLLLKLVVNELFDENAKQKIYRDLRDGCGEGMEVVIELVDNIPETPSGKRRFIISNIQGFEA